MLYKSLQFMESENIEKSKISLHIRGEIYVTSKKTLTKFPNSNMAKIVEEKLAKSNKNEIHMDVDPKSFKIILNFLENGTVNESEVTGEVNVLAVIFGLKLKP